jgi:hypothetical protein
MEFRASIAKSGSGENLAPEVLVARFRLSLQGAGEDAVGAVGSGEPALVPPELFDLF